MVQTLYLISSEIIIIVSCNKRTVEPALALTLPLVVVTDLREIHALMMGVSADSFIARGRIVSR